MKILNVIKNHGEAIGAVIAVILLIAFAFAIISATGGCLWFTDEQRAEIRDKIVELIETDGKDAAIQYIDKLVEDGRLGATNAEDIKAAIPQGIEKVKEIMEADK